MLYLSPKWINIFVQSNIYMSLVSVVSGDGNIKLILLRHRATYIFFKIKVEKHSQQLHVIISKYYANIMIIIIHTYGKERIIFLKCILHNICLYVKSSGVTLAIEKCCVKFLINALLMIWKWYSIR